MTTQTAKVINGTLTFPRDLKPQWDNAELLLIQTGDDTMIVKRMEKPLASLSEVAERVSAPAMTSEEIADEIAAYRAAV